MKKVALLYPLNTKSLKRYLVAIEKLGFEPIIIVGNEKSFNDLANRFVINGETENSSNVTKLLREIGDVVAVVAAGEFSVEIAECVAEQLNLVRAMNKSPKILRNKAIMRSEFNAYGVNQPAVFGLASNVSELEKLAGKQVIFPMISKPVDMAGSWYVCINHNKKDIVNNAIPIFEYKNAKSTGLEFSCQCLLEQYVEGQEYSAEVIVKDGKIVKHFINKKIISPLPNFDEIGHICGLTFDSGVEANLITNLNNIVDAAGVANSVIHVEFRVSDEGEIYIIEVGCRIAGDQISNLVDLKYAFNLEEAMVRLKVGLPINNIKPENDDLMCIRFLFDNSKPFSHGTQLIEKSILETIKSRPDLQNSHISNRLGYEIFTIRSKDKEKIYDIYSS